jgi:hypothetical protein
MSKSLDLTVGLWQVAGAEGAVLPTARLRGTVDDVLYVSTWPDQPWLLTANRDNIARLFNYAALTASPEQLVEMARARVSRELTPEERDQYLP